MKKKKNFCQYDNEIMHIIWNHFATAFLCLLSYSHCCIKSFSEDGIIIRVLFQVNSFFCLIILFSLWFVSLSIHWKEWQDVQSVFQRKIMGNKSFVFYDSKNFEIWFFSDLYTRACLWVWICVYVCFYLIYICVYLKIYISITNDGNSCKEFIFLQKWVEYAFHHPYKWGQIETSLGIKIKWLIL